ncbi:MAG: hypothetical protein IID44_29810 [Planctomycetes bacterium]|nr:hypothetical protein [Planctomycetota bacterium]
MPTEAVKQNVAMGFSLNIAVVSPLKIQQLVARVGAQRESKILRHCFPGRRVGRLELPHKFCGDFGLHFDDDTGLEHVKGPRQITELNIGGTKVTDAGLEHLKLLTNLTVLRLRRSKITGAGVKHLYGLRHLQSLDLRESAITDAGLEHLKGMFQLRWIDFTTTNITDAGLKHLMGLKNLEHLILWDTKVTDEGVKQLKQALPKCKFYR